MNLKGQFHIYNGSVRVEFVKKIKVYTVGWSYVLPFSIFQMPIRYISMSSIPKNRQILSSARWTFVKVFIFQNEYSFLKICKYLPFTSMNTCQKNSILKILKYFIIGLTMGKKGIVQRKNKFCLVSLNFFKKQTKEHFLIYLKIVYTNSFSSHLRVTIKILRGPAPIRKA